VAKYPEWYYVSEEEKDNSLMLMHEVMSDLGIHDPNEAAKLLSSLPHRMVDRLGGGPQIPGVLRKEFPAWRERRAGRT